MEYPLYYYLKYKSNYLEKESSGGAFYFLAEEILKLNGSIYGVKFKDTDPFSCEFSRAITIKNLIPFFGSKYIPVDYTNYNSILNSVKNDLDNDKYVLFSGKSCDINRLEKFLGDFNRYKKLYIVCIFCTGFMKDPISIKKYVSNIITLYKEKYNIDLSFKKIKFRPNPTVFYFTYPNFNRRKDLDCDTITLQILQEIYSNIIRTKSCPCKCFVKCHCDYAIGDIKLYRIDKKLIPQNEIDFNKMHPSSSSFIIYNKKGLDLIQNKMSKYNIIEANINIFKKSHHLN